MKKPLLHMSMVVVVLLLATAMPNQAALLEGPTEMATTSATSAATLAGTDSAATLRSRAEKRNFYMGAAVDYSALMSLKPYQDTLRTQYNMVVAENAMKWDATQPGPDVFDFAQADAIVDFATANKMQMRGHNLVWYNQLPSWVKSGNFTRDQLLDVMRKHISGVMGHYRGHILAWDVVNEAVADDGSLRQDLWLNVIGPDYIEQAFRFAHDADPQARLYYNDYGGEGTGRKADAIYALVSDLKNKGVPIDGVGLQMHVGIGPREAPQPDDVSANMDRLAALGLDVQITEMDVKIQNGTGREDRKLTAQASLYANMLHVCLQHKTCTAFLT